MKATTLLWRDVCRAVYDLEHHLTHHQTGYNSVSPALLPLVSIDEQHQYSPYVDSPPFYLWCSVAHRICGENNFSGCCMSGDRICGLNGGIPLRILALGCSAGRINDGEFIASKIVICDSSMESTKQYFKEDHIMAERAAIILANVLQVFV